MQPITCTKIDIHKEQVKIPATSNAITTRRMAGIFDGPAKSRPKFMPPQPTADEPRMIEETYMLHKFTDPSGTFAPTNFLVQKNELGVFTQLLLVQSKEMRELVQKYESIADGTGYQRGLARGKIDGFEAGKSQARTAVKMLPWYKRLFNRF